MTIEEEWGKEFEEWWGLGNAFIGFRESMRDAYLVACRKRQKRVKELEARPTCCNVLCYAEKLQTERKVLELTKEIERLESRLKEVKEEFEDYVTKGES